MTDENLSEKEKPRVMNTDPEHKCAICNRKASLELEDGNFICDNCAQIQHELSQEI
ncbi:hypothetical protein [Enterococcus alishanensis]